MPENKENSGIVIHGGNLTGNNLATGDYAVQTTSVHASPLDDATKKAVELIDQIRDALSTEPDDELRDEIEDTLDQTTDALTSQSSADASASRDRLTRISRSVTRLGRRAASLAEPLGQLAAAVLVVAGATGQ
ncbi:hypothetical protein [Streptomyces sp. NPDC050988]|uniref:hypothetical protein n=1 Tax=Streptomyces sp. NPDC050988 TaxID=3365637 RepID=UPI00378DF8BC